MNVTCCEGSSAHQDVTTARTTSHARASCLACICSQSFLHAYHTAYHPTDLLAHVVPSCTMLRFPWWACTQRDDDRASLQSTSRESEQPDACHRQSRHCMVGASARQRDNRKPIQVNQYMLSAFGAYLPYPPTDTFLRLALDKCLCDA
jgi:hypothetical protein